MQLVPGLSRSKSIAGQSMPVRALSPAVLAAPALPARKSRFHAPGLHLVSPTASAWSLSRSKRLFDVALSLAVLALCAVPMLLIALLIRITSPGPALFAQKRVGRWDTLFSVYKFRSMQLDSAPGIGLTREGDCRVTTFGRWLRRLKLDELPQFFNVLRGQMSIVGPRPKLPQYASIANMPYRPGVTGAATLVFRREEEILGRVHPAQMEDFYHRHIKPLKARIDARYMGRATFGSDLRIVAATFAACIAPPREPVLLRKKAACAPGFDPLSAVEGIAGESMGPPN
jgi:lipopolysaccharide/colanic/teichoic acid biosynthesis glycosyltransferase